jgi:hypothetical protein
MEDIMAVVHVTKKGKLMDALECFHICKENNAGNQINDRLTAKENAIFETIIQEDTYKRRLAPSQSSGLKKSVVGSRSPPQPRRYLNTEGTSH